MNAWAYQSGTAGTCTVPAGCVLTHIRAESHSAAGTVAIFGGSAVSVDGAAPVGSHIIFELQFPLTEDPTRPGELLGPQSVAGATDIVFANTVSWFVGYIRR